MSEAILKKVWYKESLVKVVITLIDILLNELSILDFYVLALVRGKLVRNSPTSIGREAAERKTWRCNQINEQYSSLTNWAHQMEDETKRRQKVLV